MSDEDFELDPFLEELLEKHKPKKVGPGEYLGSDHLRYAKTLHERADFRRAMHKALEAILAWPTSPMGYVVAGDALSMIDDYEIDRLNPARPDLPVTGGIITPAG